MGYDRSEESEKRAGPTVVAFLLGSIALAILVGVGILINNWLAKRAEEDAFTRKQVAALAKRADETRKDGRYVPLKPEDITELDAWGKPLQVSYEPARDDHTTEYVTVRSAGRDGRFDTGDEEAVRMDNAVPDEIAKEFGGAVRHITGAGLRGIMDGVADAFTKKKEE